MSGMVERLNRAAATWWEWTVASTGQGALLLLLVLAMLAAGRSLRPGFRYGLLLVVLLKFAVPPVFGVAYGFSDLLARAFTNEPAPLANSDLRVTVETSPAPSTPSPIVPVATFRPQAPVLSTKAWLLLLEAAGAAVIVFLIARQCLVARTLIWNGAVAEETLQERFHAMARSLKLRRTPRLRLSEAAGAPQSGGILRPFIILPAWAATMPEDELDILLAHELAHVRRMDALVNGIQAATQALLWWNPAIWWLNRRIREEREFCCDDLVLSRGIASGAAYSRTLVNVAERVSLPQSSWAMAGMADSFGAIDRRVRRALEGGHGHRGWGHYGALVTLLLVAGWVLPGATDGAEKEFDASRAAEFEEAFRIRDLTAEKSAVTKDGALMRSGKLGFRVESAKNGMSALKITATGELVYPQGEEQVKVVVEGEVQGIYPDLTVVAKRLTINSDGVVEFFELTMDSTAFRDLKAARMVLDLRDGAFQLAKGKADEVGVSDLVPVQEDESRILNMWYSRATRDGAVTQFKDIDFMLDLGEALGEVRLQAKHLDHANTGDNDGRMFLNGNVVATFSDLTVTAETLLIAGQRMHRFQFNKAVVVSADYGTISAEQAVVDFEERKLQLLNGTVDETHLKAAFGDSVKNAPKGEWLTLPFAVGQSSSVSSEIQSKVRALRISTSILEVSADADILPDHEMKIAEHGESFNLLGGGVAEQWEAFERACRQAVENGQAKFIASPTVETLVEQSASITIGEQVTSLENAPTDSALLPVTTVRAAPVADTDEGGAGALSVEVEIERGLPEVPGVEGASGEKDLTRFVIAPDEMDGDWRYHVTRRDGGKPVVIVVRVVSVERDQRTSG